MVKKVGKYEIGKTIGEGTFGKVKLAINTETGDKMAIKVMRMRESASHLGRGNLSSLLIASAETGHSGTPHLLDI